MPELQAARRGILKTQINRCTSNVTPSPACAGYDGKIQCTRKHQQLKPSYAGLTRVSIDLQQEHCSLGMDCRVKPGNDDLEGNLKSSDCIRRPRDECGAPCPLPRTCRASALR